MELISYAALLWAWLERLVAAIPRFLIFATAAYVIIYCTTLALVAGVHRHWWRIAWFRSLFYWQFPLTFIRRDVLRSEPLPRCALAMDCRHEPVLGPHSVSRGILHRRPAGDAGRLGRLALRPLAARGNGRA